MKTKLPEYPNFAALAYAHKEGKDFERTILPRTGASVVVLAPHGGRIEPHTDAIASEIALNDFSLYSFRSKVPTAQANLHITSNRFDDPSCIDLVKKHQWAVSIHGCSNDGNQVFLGGLDTDLISHLYIRLRSCKIPVQTNCPAFPGTDVHNICNRTSTGRGVQFELSNQFRRGHLREVFVKVVRSVLLGC